MKRYFVIQSRVYTSAPEDLEWVRTEGWRQVCLGCMRPHLDWYPKPQPVHLKCGPEAPLSRSTKLGILILSKELATWALSVNKKAITGAAFLDGYLLENFKTIYGCSEDDISILGGEGSAEAGAYKACKECGRPYSTGSF